MMNDRDAMLMAALERLVAEQQGAGAPSMDPSAMAALEAEGLPQEEEAEPIPDELQAWLAARGGMGAFQ
jgi:hypothetical protein